jgi:hypothetical protein
MPHSKSHLLPRQVDVLSWISDGCPEGVMTDINHRITARALANRGFATIHGHGPTWTATVTTAGTAALQSAAKPDEEARAAETEAEVLLRAVLDSGGSLSFTGKRDHEKEVRLIAAALRVPWRPEGKKLELFSPWDGDPEWRIVDHFPDKVVAAPVPVPDMLRKPHPAVAAYEENKEWQQVSKPHLRRASLLLQAIAVEAELRGYTARPRKKSTSPYGRSNDDEPAVRHLVIEIDGFPYPITIREISEPGGGSVDYHARAKLPGWQQRRRTAFISTGRLQLSLDHAWNGRQHEFRDSKRSTLDDSLPQLLREIEIRHLEDQARHTANEEAEARKHKRWERAMRDAKADLQFDHKATRLRDQISAWHEVRSIRGYADAMKANLAGMPAEARGEAEAWIEWAEAYAARLDPLTRKLAVPADRSFTASDLTPYLGRLSPYGP